MRRLSVSSTAAQDGEVVKHGAYYRKFAQWVALFCAAGLLAGCRTGASTGLQAQPLEVGALVHFLVWDACSDDGIAGAAVSVLYRNGRIEDLGTTNSVGEVTVRRDLLASKDLRFVLACAPYYTCTAIRADARGFPVTDIYLVPLARGMLP